MKAARRVIGFAALWLGLAPAIVGPQTPQEKEKQIQPPSSPLPFSYDPGDRRDPFRDLFAGRDVTEKKSVGELSDLSVDEVVLMGIVKIGGKYEAVIGLGQGFPITIHEGDSLADGFVLSIEESHVVLRKTKERGIPLTRPKDILKEISQQER